MSEENTKSHNDKSGTRRNPKLKSKKNDNVKKAMEK